MRNIGIHHNILKLISRVFSPRSKNRPATDPTGKQCQIFMLKVLYEFLYYFIWINDTNCIELTRSDYLDMLFMQLDLDKSVVQLLTEIIVDNDFANNLVAEQTVDGVV
jgi:hypothetical protein